MNRNRKSNTYHSTLLFVASLLAGVGAIAEFGVSSASADASDDCKFSFSDPFYTREPDGINTSGTLRCDSLPVYNEITFTLELWYQKFDPRTGRYSEALGCSNPVTLQQNYLVGNRYTCAGVSSQAEVQLRGIGTGYDGHGVEFHVEGSSDWKQL